jgi:hypothetical protein
MNKIVDAIVEKYGLDDKDFDEEEGRISETEIMRGVLKWNKEFT